MWYAMHTQRVNTVSAYFNKMQKALFLCSGTGSVGEPFREAGWEVTDVDWDARFGVEIVEEKYQD